MAFATRPNKASAWEIVSYEADEKIKLNLDEQGKLPLPPSHALPYAPPPSDKEIRNERTAYDLKVFRNALVDFKSDKEAESADILLLLIATAESVGPASSSPSPTEFQFDIRLDALIFNALPFRVIYLFPAAAVAFLTIGWGMVLLQWLLVDATTPAPTVAATNEGKGAPQKMFDPFEYREEQGQGNEATSATTRVATKQGSAPARGNSKPKPKQKAA